MSAHARKIELAGAVAVTTDEDWNTLTEKPGLTVVDVYAKWAGPCEPMQNIFKRLKLDYGEQVTFATALTDGIEALESYRNKSCPTFLFFFNGVLVNLIKGANSPLIESTIKDQLDLAAKGQAHPPYRHGDLRVSAHTNGAPVTRTGGSKADLAGGVSDNLSATTPYTPMSATAESTLAIIKPDAMGPELINQIMNQIRLHRFEVVQKKKVWLSPEQVEQLYREHEKANYFQGVLTHMSTAPILALVLSKDNAVQDWRKLMGPANPATARDQAPSSIRASLGTDNRLNAVFGSESLEAAGHEIDLIFGPNTSVLELPMLEIKDTPPPAGAHAEKTLAIIKPDIVDTSKLDAIIERIICRGYQVIKRETINLSADQAADLYSHQKETPYFADTVAFMSSGPVVALVLKGYGVVSGWREMIGPTDPEVARNTVPMSIRAIFGTDTVRNAVHGSDGAENATREVEALFPSLLMRSESGIYNARTSTTAGAALSENAVRAAKHAAEDNVLTERTCALIKPDAFASGKRDEIVQRIRDAGFKIVAEKEVELTRAQAEEFYKEHLGQGFYEDLVRWMSTPDLPIYAMVLEKDAAITAWRELAGPTNSNKAREVAPNSIRAIYGKDGSKNAVHGSDSPQSAEREIKIIFGDTVSARAEGARPHQRVAAARSTTELLDPSGPLLQRTLALIKPDAYGAGKKDDIVKRIKEDGFRIVKESEVKWSEEKAKEFYREHEGKSFYDHLVAWMSSAPIYALVLEKSDGIKGWRDLAGPTNSNTARESAPQSIRALYGTDGSQNAVHGSDSAASAVREINIVFGNDVSPFTEEHQNFATNRVIGAPPSGILRQRTLALIKPDAYAAGHRDDIVARIQKAGFRIVQQKEIKLTEEKAGEFYREHASRPFYSDLVAWMSSTAIYALVLEKEDAITEWRELAGPTDSVKARANAPHSIRALYGTDGSHNAVHGSDSPASAEREIQLIFPHEAGKSSAAQHPSATLSGQPFQRTLALIKPDAYPARKNDILTRIRDAGFTIVGEKDVQFSKEIAESFYAEHVGKTFYADLVKWMSSAPIYALVLEKEGAISGWRELAGPTNSATARENAPNSIRALYGKNGSSNAVHGSDSEESAKREIQIVFGETVSPFATAKGVKAAIPKTKSQGALASVESSVPFPSGQLGQDERHLERTLALIKPDAYGLHRDAILSRVQDDGFVIIKQEEVTFTREKAAEFYKEHLGKPFYDRLVEWMSSAPIYALVLEKEGAIKAWRELAGPTNAETARNTAPNSIRALYGTDGSQNAVHGSDSAASAIREIGIVFGDSVKAGPAYSEKTLALLKPDVSRSAHKDEIIQLINQSGLKIADEKVLTFTADKAKEFYREHEGKPFFDGLVQWMTSAPIYALILEGENAIKRWRELAGPTDSTKAKETAPTSIRGRFGTDGQKNAVHGSDSPASAAREIDIVFAHGDVAPHPPSAAKPAAAPARVAAASTKRSTNNLANGKNMGSQSVLASKSRSPSRTSSNSGLNKAGTKATASSDRLATKPASRVSSTQNLSNARTKSSAALKKSNLGLNTPGGEKDSPPAALELPGHIETHRGEGVDKVPIDGNAGPGIMDDPTNVAVREE